MKSSVCGLVLFVTFLAGCQPSRFLAAFNRPKEPNDRFRYDDDDQFPDDGFDRQRRSDPRSRSRRPDASVARMISRAKADLKRKNLVAAQRGFAEVLRVDRDNSTAHHHLAMIADQRGEYRKAEQHYEAAYRAEPRNPHLLCNIGYSYYLQGDYRRSEEFLRKALREDPNHKRALYNMGALQGKQGDLQAARRYFQRAGATASETADLIADLQSGQLRGGVRTAGGFNADRRDARPGAPNPRSSNGANDPRYDPNYVKRLMEKKRQEAEAARRSATRRRSDNDDMGQRSPWRSDDDRGRSSSTYGSRDYDDRTSRYGDASRYGGLSERQIRRRLESDDRVSNRYGPPGRDHNDNRRDDDSRRWKEAPTETPRRYDGIQISPRNGNTSNRGANLPAPANSNNNDNRPYRDSGKDPHLFPAGGGDSNRGTIGNRGNVDGRGNSTAQLPPGRDPFDGDDARGISERDREALRMAKNVGVNGMFPTPTKGTAGNERDRGMRDAAYHGRRTGGVQPADYRRNTDDRRSSYGDNNRSRYTQFSRGSDQRLDNRNDRSREYDRDSYDRRGSDGSGSRDHEIQFLPQK